ncbi:MAG TPA: SPFH domain-containing protein [Polyangiaceae bacterium]
MTLVIQRPDDAGGLVHRFENTLPPINSQLVVNADESVVVISNGAVLGVVPPGMHWLHPQPFPFLLPAIVGGNAFQTELWFVKSIPMVGIRFGGALPEVVDRVTQLAVSPRTMGDFSLVVRDPARLVAAMVGMSTGDLEPVLRWVKTLVLRQLGAAVGKEVEGGKDVLSPGLVPDALDRVAGELGELESSGLAVTRFGEVMLTFSEADITALKDARVAAAKAKIAAAQAPKPAAASTLKCSKCSKVHEGGRFCVDCGGALGVG